MKNLVELNYDELKSYEGGGPPIAGVAAVAVGCGIVVGAVVLGAVVGYVVYSALRR